eukprot:3776576-Amphidinium_carterae.1
MSGVVDSVNHQTQCTEDPKDQRDPEPLRSGKESHSEPADEALMKSSGLCRQPDMDFPEVNAH